MSNISSIPNEEIQYPNNIETKKTLPKLSIGLFVTGGVCLAIGVAALVANLILPGGLLLAIGILAATTLATDLSIMLIAFGTALVLGGITNILWKEAEHELEYKTNKKEKELCQETIQFIDSMEAISTAYGNAQINMRSVEGQLKKHLYPKGLFDRDRAHGMQTFIEMYEQDPNSYPELADKMPLLSLCFNNILRSEDKDTLN